MIPECGIFRGSVYPLRYSLICNLKCNLKHDCDLLSEDQVIATLLAKKKAKRDKKYAKLRRKKAKKYEVCAIKSKDSPLVHDNHIASDDLDDESCVDQKEAYEEARKTWDLGKSLRLYAESDDSVTKALAKGLKLKKEDLIQIESKRGRGKNNRKKKDGKLTIGSDYQWLVVSLVVTFCLG